jgi:hypothetical protein
MPEPILTTEEINERSHEALRAERDRARPTRLTELLEWLIAERDTRTLDNAIAHYGVDDAHSDPFIVRRATLDEVVSRIHALFPAPQPSAEETR